MTDHPNLDDVRVASPCPASWDAMTGDDRTRFCAECELNVYNLSAMSRSEAEALVREREGRLCVRFFQRADGTLLTRDCPVGWRALRRKAAMARARVVAMLSLFAAWMTGCRDRVAPVPDPAPDDTIQLQGEICLPEDLIEITGAVCPEQPPTDPQHPK